MSRYIAKRLMILIPTLVVVSVLVFGMLHLAPGDPAVVLLGERASPEEYEALRQELGLDDPFLVQYARWAGKALRLDLGRSIRSHKAVTEEIRERLGATAELAVAAIAVAVLLGVPAGVISATRPNSMLDHAVTVGALAGVSMPVFWQGLMLIIIFSVRLGWLPSSGHMGGWQYLVLPAITLGTGATAGIARMTRASMLEAIRQDYVRTARSKGVPEPLIIYWHALRNALIPVVTVTGLEFGALMAGAVITETIFAWPGIGRLAVDAISARDFPVVQGVILTFAVTYALVNLAVDVLYAYLDPRLRVRYS